MFIKIAVIAAVALALSSLAVMAVQNVMAALDQLPGAGQFAPGNQFFHGTGESPTDPYRFSPQDPYRDAPGILALDSGGIGTGPG